MKVDSWLVYFKQHRGELCSLVHLQVPFSEAPSVPPSRLAELFQYLLETKGQDGGSELLERGRPDKFAKCCLLFQTIVPGHPPPPPSSRKWARKDPPFLNRFCLIPRKKKTAAHSASKCVCLRRVCQPVPLILPALFLYGGGCLGLGP